MRVSIHDLVTANEGETTDEVFLRTKNMVKVAENLGYHRYWFSEHHGMDANLSTSPEILIAYFAGLTSKIRLGSGGTMIMHYSPLKIAENFKTLISLAKDRVDIGFGRAPGGDAKSIIALSEGKGVNMEDLYQKIEYILNYFKDEEISDRRYKTPAIPDKTSSLPSPWMLGSSGNSANFASHMGLGYSYAKFFSVEAPDIVFSEYKRNFRPSVFFDRPELMFSYMVVVADSKEEADYLAKPIEMMFLSIMNHPKPLKILDPEYVKDYKFSQAQENLLKNRYEKRYFIKGDKNSVGEILQGEAKRYDLDEIMIYSPIYSEAKRHESYRAIAEIFSIKP